MKLDNKGITLTELIISIALISIVIMFLFRLLVDVRYMNNNTDFDRENQQTRAIILKTLQTEFLEKKLTKIEESGSSNSETNIKFTYANNEVATLKIEADSISYKNNSGTEKWLLKKETDATRIAFRCVDFYSSLQGVATEGEFFSIKIHIPIVVNQSKNTLDDIELFYLGERKDLVEVNPLPTNYQLGHYDANTCG